MPSTKRFEESQRFHGMWMWIIVLVAAAPMWVLFFLQIVAGKAVGSQPAPNALVWTFFLLLGVGLPLLFWFMRLHVVVDDEGLRMTFRPFKRMSVAHEEIQACEAVTYSPIGEFGGWGLRYRMGFGMAYSVSGKQGVIVDLTDGKRVMIGSQRAEELAAALEKTVDGPLG